MLIDSHMHIYESAPQGSHHKATYPITEYGAKGDVRYSSRGGDLHDALESIHAAGFAYAVVANLFYTTRADEHGVVEEAPGTLSGGAREHDRESARLRLVEYNYWMCSLAAEHPELIALVSVDPWVMDGADLQQHLRESILHRGARGLKLHPKAQRVSASDRRLWPAYETCAELGVPILVHSGFSDANTYSEPDTFRVVLDSFPNLRLILAHLGGGAWTQTAAVARDYPNLLFDCSEIIAWAGAPGAPTAEELALLIRNIGADRVLLGTDFPWYDLDATTQQVRELPMLSEEEKELILGANAARAYSLSAP